MTEDELFGMMKITKDLQASANAAIDGIASERAALAKDRAAMTTTFAQQAEAVKAAAGNVSNVAVTIRQAAADSIPAIQEAAGAAVGQSVADSLNGASKTAVEAIRQAAEPLLGQLTNATTDANTAAGNLKSAAKWYSWKASCVLAAGVAGLLWATYLIFVSLVWWQGSRLKDLRQEEATLQAQVDKLQTSADALKRGNFGLWVAKGGDGRFAFFPNGYEAATCRNGTPCVKIK